LEQTVNETTLSKGLGHEQKTVVYAPGTRVLVTQQIARRAGAMTAVVEGVVVRQERQGSGSWFARNSRSKVWLDRLVVRKDDGEMSILNLDEYTRVEVVSGPQPTGGSSPMVLPNSDASSGVT
jgi:hypothetical protein